METVDFLYQVSALTREHSDWMRSCEFYRQELDMLNNRLAEVSSRYTAVDVKSQVEHFQNQFIVQIANLANLRHDVHHHEHRLSDDAIHHVGAIANHTMAEHDNLRERYFILERAINELRHEFNKFLAQYR